MTVVGSIAFATDLAALTAEGSVVEREAGYRVVRTPQNPAFRWGNFLLADADAELDDPRSWALLHRKHFPDLGFVAVGVDDPAPRFAEEHWRAAGFTIEHNAVLRAPVERIIRPVDAPIRPLTTDADWAETLAIGREEEPADEDPAFGERRNAMERLGVENGAARWLGADVDGRIVASLGIVDGGDGVARYQNVQTLRAYRRRGLASDLLAAAARVAADEFAARELVIVAESPGPAVGLYRRLGFADSEVQVQMTLM
jgi:ribosomal protein S18 acetylase RimI-like enzyme